MKLVLLTSVLAGVLMSVGVAVAVEPGMPPQDPTGRIEHLQNKLGLTDSQVSEISTIEAAQQEKMKALHDEFQLQISSILSEDQAVKLAQMQAQQKPPVGGMGNDGQRPPPPPDGGMGAGMGGQQPPPMQGGEPPAGNMADRMKSDLGLTDEQAAQMQALQQQQRAQMDALRTETQQLIKQVLTAEQATAFDQMQAAQPPRGLPGGPRMQ